MLLPEPATITVLLSLLTGYGYEGYRYEHPKDPDPAIVYYDPDYFKLGDEDSCGDETNGPCHGREKTVIKAALLPTEGSEVLQANQLPEVIPTTTGCKTCKR